MPKTERQKTPWNGRYSMKMSRSSDGWAGLQADLVTSLRTGNNKTTMINPPHPGRSIRENCLEPLGLNVTDAARVLAVARHTLSRVLNGHAAISPKTAIRLEKAGWSNAEFWLRRQGTYDLAQARKREDRIHVAR